ncbi:MAG: hypothetical protein ACLS7Z_02365 [Christensenellales bacterium]
MIVTKPEVLSSLAKILDQIGKEGQIHESECFRSKRRSDAVYRFGEEVLPPFARALMKSTARRIIRPRSSQAMQKTA